MAMEFKRRLPIPMEIRKEMPLSAELTAKKQAFDAEVAKVFTGEDARKVLIIGPCSADREDSVLEYMNRLAKTAEEVQPGLAEVYPTATVMDLNGTSVVAFHDADEDVLGIVVMDTVDPGYYIFMFTPASDADFLPVADAIAASYTAAQ